jgi:hypothetical protein
MKLAYDDNRGDGFGAQYIGIITVFTYCMVNNYTYIHKNIKRMLSINSIKHDIETKNWNNAFFCPPGQEYGNKESIKIANKLIGIPHNNDVADKKHSYIIDVFLQPDLYFSKKNMDIIREYYYKNNTKKINNCISIHIRRGNVKVNRFPKRFIGNDIYISKIKKLRNMHQDLKIIIYSEGKKSDFNDILESDNNIELKLNDDFNLTFQELVQSKILVVAKSSFSYVAGLLNENTIYYIYDSKWTRSLKFWKQI